MRDKRQHHRLPSNEKIQVYWIDEQGTYHREVALSYDHSPAGVCILLRNPVNRDCYVAVRNSADGRTTGARIRHITRTGMLYRTGLEFR
jgi:hypothetical protein